MRVLAPRHFDYSGLASATAAGSVPADAGRIDVRALARRHGVELVEDTLSGLDLLGRCATTAGGAQIEYDVVSLNIGSIAAAPGMEVGAGVLRVKEDGLVVLLYGLLIITLFIVVGAFPVIIRARQ